MFFQFLSVVDQDVSPMQDRQINALFNYLPVAWKNPRGGKTLLSALENPSHNFED